ncbi:aminotransferase class V-fold PLP-dependent enzyme [Mesorhizobium sp. AR02]|uniref:aminotransferase class V-fold PLP-dependent enzyme n=1 Tax=Mesorhizobium sp. AR02 TaxID=2865837 RepID=UPI00215F163E|nr:aminotransferase class V-fold PLP-dependent enzyme [Mesorhizobium sp. AR02]
MAAFTVAFIRLVLPPFAQDELMTMWKIGRDVVGNMYHWNGRLLPVEDLCALAREHDIITVVDGAQTFAQMPLSFRKLDCDIFVTSLHKWLGAPAGNGMLVVREGRKRN